MDMMLTILTSPYFFITIIVLLTVSLTFRVIHFKRTEYPALNTELQKFRNKYATLHKEKEDRELKKSAPLSKHTQHAAAQLAFAHADGEDDTAALKVYYDEVIFDDYSVASSEDKLYRDLTLQEYQRVFDAQHTAEHENAMQEATKQIRKTVAFYHSENMKQD